MADGNVSEKRKVIGSVLLNWIGRACALVITFFLTPFLLHTLGQERYGIWAIVMAFTGYYALADIGLGNAGVRYIAEYEAKGDRLRVERVVVTTFYIYCGLAVCCVFISLIASVFLPGMLTQDVKDAVRIQYVLFMVGCSVAVGFVGQTFSSVITALHRFDIRNALGVGVQVTTAVSMVIVLKYGWGLIGMAVVTLVVTTVVQVLYFLIVQKLLNGFSLSIKFFDRETARKSCRFGGITYCVQIARRVTEWSGALLVGLIVGPSAVPFYSIPESFSTKFLQLGRGINSVVYPLTSKLAAQERHEAIKKILLLGTRILLAMSLCAAGTLIVLGGTFIAVWIGPEYESQTYPVLCVLTLGNVLLLPGRGLRTVLRGADKLHLLVKAAIAEAFITLLSGSILIYFYGPIGMAVAVLMAQIVASGLIIPIGACQLFEIPYRRFVLSVVGWAALAAVFPICTALVCNQLWEVDRMLQLVPQFALVGLVGGLSIFIFCLDSESKQIVLSCLIPASFINRTTVLKDV